MIWNLIVAWICISLMTNNNKFFFILVAHLYFLFWKVSAQIIGLFRHSAIWVFVARLKTVVLQVWVTRIYHGRSVTVGLPQRVCHSGSTMAALPAPFSCWHVHISFALCFGDSQTSQMFFINIIMLWGSVIRVLKLLQWLSKYQLR